MWRDGVATIVMSADERDHVSNGNIIKVRSAGFECPVFEDVAEEAVVFLHESEFGVSG